jgi:hypothetical protein
MLFTREKFNSAPTFGPCNAGQALLRNRQVPKSPGSHHQIGDFYRYDLVLTHHCGITEDRAFIDPSALEATVNDG